MSVQSTLEQMVRHVSNSEQTKLATSIDGGQLPDGRVSARLLFIHVLGWIRARGSHRWTSPMRLPDHPWAGRLKEVVQAYPELSEVFEIQDDLLNFNRTLAGPEIHWAESYVVENYRPVARI
jgi:hypothetical protein